MKTLDEVQQEAHDAVFAEFDAGRESTLVVSPTGSGKTAIGSKIIRTFKERTGKPSLFLVNRKDLATQAEDSLTGRGLLCAVEMGERYAPRDAGAFGDLDAVVGSKDTMQKGRLASWKRDKFACIIADECDLSVAQSYRNIFEYFDDYRLVGLTATTRRLDGVPLIPTLFESRAFHYPLKDYPDGRAGAVTNGHVARPVGHVMPLEIDIRGLRVARGDFAAGEFESRLAPHLNEIAGAILKEIDAFGLRKVMGFTPNVRTAVLLADVCNEVARASGRAPRFAAVHGDTKDHPMSDREREAIKESYRAGEILGVFNCDLWTRGFDVPAIDSVFMIRATKSIALFQQAIGRGIRRAPGKDEAHIFGFGWTSDDDEGLVSTVDLFLDDADDARTREIARGMARGSGEFDPDQVARAARKERDREREDEARKTLRKQRIRAKKVALDYERIDFDPLGLPPSVLPDWEGWDAPPLNPINEGQIRMLEAYGVLGSGNLSTEAADHMIRRLLGRDNSGFASPAQILQLTSPSFRYTREDAEKMSRKQAGAILGTQYGEWKKKRKARG